MKKIKETIGVLLVLGGVPVMFLGAAQLSSTPATVNEIALAVILGGHILVQFGAWLLAE